MLKHFVNLQPVFANIAKLFEKREVFYLFSFFRYLLYTCFKWKY